MHSLRGSRERFTEVVDFSAISRNIREGICGKKDGEGLYRQKEEYVKWQKRGCILGIILLGKIRKKG